MTCLGPASYGGRGIVVRADFQRTCPDNHALIDMPQDWQGAGCQLQAAWQACTSSIMAHALDLTALACMAGPAGFRGQAGPAAEDRLGAPGAA